MSSLLKARSNVKSIEPAHGVARWLSHPWAPSVACPEGQAGLCLINGTPYLTTLLGEVAGGRFELQGVRLTKSDGQVYDTDLIHSSCDCADGTFRSERPNGCKHQAALRALLPVAGIPLPKPVYGPVAHPRLQELGRDFRPGRDDEPRRPGRQPASQSYRSAGDYAANDPEGWERHCLDLTGPDEAA